MKISKKLQEVLDQKNLMLVSGGGDFNKTTHLVNLNKVVSTGVVSLVCRKDQPKEVFLKNNPGAVFTGEVNFLGHFKAKIEYPKHKTTVVFSEAHIWKVLKSGDF